MNIISIAIPGHGAISIQPWMLDSAIAKYLPASPSSLREIVEDRTGLDYRDVKDVSTFLLILADFDRQQFEADHSMDARIVK